MGLEHHGLQVGTRIRLGQRHGARRTARHERQVLLLDLLAGEFVDRLGAVLQTPDVFEAGIAAGHHLVGHHEADERHVQTLVLAGQVNAAQTGLADCLEVGLRAAGVHHVVVHHLRAFLVDILGVGGDHVGADVTRDLQHAAVAVHGILEVGRCVVVEILLREVLLAQLHDLLHQRMVQLELQVLII